MSSNLTTKGHTYPRIACFTWGGAPADWYARFDLLDIFTPHPSFIRSIKEINPDIWIVNTIDWNASAGAGKDIPEPLRMLQANGTNISWYNFADFTAPKVNGWATNFSDVCPKWNGIRGNQWFAEYVTKRTDLDVFDGVSTDGLHAAAFIHWVAPRCDADFDRNSITDYSEHGEDWMANHYKKGVKTLINNVRKIVGDKLIIINSGLQFSGHDNVQAINGALIEYFGTSIDINNFLKTYKNYMSALRNPQINLIQTNSSPFDPWSTDRTKDYYSFMRYTLCLTLLGNGYYMYEPEELKGFAEHYYVTYYDEFDLDVGYPTHDMQELFNGVWVRFFTDGVSIVNTSGKTVTIKDSDLQTLEGYTGPYYRFQGGQDPEFNDGSHFNSIDLFGGKYREWNQFMYPTGDGIILVKEPTTRVADIIIDDCEVGTSPGQDPATLVGDWEHMYDAKNHSWNLRTSTGHKFWSYSESSYKGGSAQYNFNIGLGAKYEVFEWHGTGLGGTAHVTIPHDDGTVSNSINQAVAGGQWNSLGTYYFGKGVNSIELTGGESFVADAIMLRRRSEGTPTPTTKTLKPDTKITIGGKRTIGASKDHGKRPKSVPEGM